MYNVNLLANFNHAVKKSWDLSKKKSSFIKILRHGKIQHPPYSPNLTPSDKLPLQIRKKILGGKEFGSNDGVIAETNAHFKGLEKSYFSSGRQNRKNSVSNCDYVEK